ncbi:hypothetical protein M378DRAFT_14478 [Amanita muscaria Koide BX008]|uniref:Uncharacterized protein n=1 Tax=Amanita muscaria (strain Koide BX008) TaxID=946122 RepID=A0A0C2WEV3_AMAMK|nr:hypothetical protein M378DRAFT_14478 [Amanita muscaria Koide BX008]
MQDAIECAQTVYGEELEEKWKRRARDRKIPKGTKGTSKKRDLEEFQADIEVIDVDDVDVDTPPFSAPTNTSDEQSEKRREEKEFKFLKTTEHLLAHETLERAFHVKYECTGKEFEDSEIAGLSKMAASCEEVEAIVDKMRTGKD